MNETTGTEPFLQAFINGQIASYVDSCYTLLPNGEPDCDKIEGDCADSSAACEYVYVIASLVFTGVMMGLLLAAAFIGCCLVGCCCTPKHASLSAPSCRSWLRMPLSTALHSP